MKVISDTGDEIIIDETAWEPQCVVFKKIIDIKGGSAPLELSSDMINLLNKYFISIKGTKLVEVPKPVPNNKLETFLSETDYKFISQMEIKQVRQVLKAGHYLSASHLEAICYAYLAVIFIGLTTQEFVQKYNIPLPYSEEIEAAIQKKYKNMIGVNQ